MQMERKISAEEATILSCDRPKHESDFIDLYYDCSTCAYWLSKTMSQSNEKICRKCISPFCNEKSILYSPINGDYKSVNNSSGCNDIRTERDNYDVLKCCDNINTSTNLNSPLNRIVPRYREEDFIACQFSSCGCNFRTSDFNQLNIHNEENIHRHMNMMLSQLGQNGKEVKSSLHSLNKNENENGHLNDGSDVYPLEMKKLNERIKSLEQELREYKLDVKRLSMVINTISISNLKNRSGTLVWQIGDFEKKVQTMLNNPNTMYYSPDFYTDPNGYRFCARISISTKSKAKDTLSFHVHMMQSENDFHLDWPFRGCIQIFMIHEDSKLTQRDKIMTNEKSTAFQRPNNDISAHSFGFTEYANINSIINDGFLSSDGKLTIKLHIGIV